MSIIITEKGNYRLYISVTQLSEDLFKEKKVYLKKYLLSGKRYWFNKITRYKDIVRLIGTLY